VKPWLIPEWAWPNASAVIGDLEDPIPLCGIRGGCPVESSLLGCGHRVVELMLARLLMCDNGQPAKWYLWVGLQPDKLPQKIQSRRVETNDNAETAHARLSVQSRFELV